MIRRQAEVNTGEAQREETKFIILLKTGGKKRESWSCSEKKKDGERIHSFPRVRGGSWLTILSEDAASWRKRQERLGRQLLFKAINMVYEKEAECR